MMWVISAYSHGKACFH